MLKGFKTFLFRGNVVDLAVAVVIGAAFGAVINSLVTNIITPIIAALVGQPDFSSIHVMMNGTPIMVGAFLNSLLAFLLVAAAIYFVMVAPMNAWVARQKRGEAPADPTSKKCPECVSEIPIAARRCAFCAQPVG
ncbi:MAG TPA: large conductance mechanosensitive channel protein MscL [Terriglobales bacterium]|nr:large conductance mechanosensitive channel protein MscL [Terriglobales bacterium]